MTNVVIVYKYLAAHPDTRRATIVEDTGLHRSSVGAVLLRNDELFERRQCGKHDRGKHADIRWSVKAGSKPPKEKTTKTAAKRKTAKPAKAGDKREFDYRPVYTLERHSWRPPQRERARVIVDADPSMMTKPDYISAAVNGFLDWMANRQKATK